MKVFSLKKFMEGAESFGFSLSELNELENSFKELDCARVESYKDDHRLYITGSDRLISQDFVVEVEDWRPYKEETKIQLEKEELK